MTNISYMQLSLSMVVLNAIMLVFEIKNIKKLSCIRFLALMSLCLILWGVFFILFYLETNPMRALNWYHVRFVCISFVSVIFLMFTVTYLYPTQKLSFGLMFNMLIIPIITCLICLYPPFRQYLYSNLSFVSFNPLKQLEFNYGFWYWIHVTYTFFAFLLCAFMAGRRVAQAPIFLKTIYIALCAAPIIVIIYNLMIMFPFVKLSFNTTLAVMTASHYLYFWVTIFRQEDYFLIQLKDTAFEKLSDPAIILNTERQMIECNQAAREIFTSSDNILHQPFDNMITEWIQNLHGSYESNDNTVIKIKPDKNKSFYYRIKETSVRDHRGREIGIFIEMRNITAEQELIIELYQLLNHDKLTGVYSRRYFMEMLKKIDTPENFPICILFGDVDKLKKANDEYGHETGDKLLAEVAKCLQANLEKGWIVARLGGDEFCILAAKTDDERIQLYINRIHQQLSTMKVDGKVIPQISLGYTLKTHVDEDIDELLNYADKNMYEEKTKRMELRCN